ncbi:Hypothetical protein LUCI_1724 [Lucifera butyrica]|uniref:IrrE N-terminal-like domain-containing protein n=1 Tax=Lucifera butyrica TaxID=1351585 RepID=A0A498R4W7_9FIRM|nr:ImmA/IrrE family metallo-endopeptidase [Lucifera butyrica]VBB06491.1 Hypothetical protein LUCI_1724 [Lucifera butyrica]
MAEQTISDGVDFMTKEVIVEQAQIILEKYKPFGVAGMSLLDKICDEYNIIVEQHMFHNSFNGMLWTKNRQYYILINCNLCPSRWLFTYAHEVGHWWLHRHIRGNFFCGPPNGQTYNPVEHEANIFAAELLLPREQILQCLDSGLTVKKIARIYRVSEEAATYRVKELQSRSV